MSSSQLANLKSRLSQVYKAKRESTEQVVETMVEVGTGAAMGVVDQRYGTAALMGTSVPLVAGVVLTAAGISGKAGGMGDVAIAAGRACLTVEAYRRSGTMYRQWAADNDGVIAGEEG